MLDRCPPAQGAIQREDPTAVPRHWQLGHSGQTLTFRLSTLQVGQKKNSERVS